MSEWKSKEYASVDLTEDEDSSGVDSPFDFVDCSGDLNNSTSSAAQFGSPSHCSSSTVLSSVAGLPAKTSTPKYVIVKQTLKSRGVNSNKKVGQFTSVQIKPPDNSVSSTNDIRVGDTSQEIETVSLDSDNEEESTNHLRKPSTLQPSPQPTIQTNGPAVPQTQTMYSPKQPPGKVVIIKKNNKYYKIIIPHNVMPNINQSMGPVLINIPEVGPLVISNDPQAANVTPSQTATQQLSLNLDADDQNPHIPEKKVSKKVYNPLTDKKYCWTYILGRKRDLDGFIYTDRLGFSGAEKQRAKKCERKISWIIQVAQKKLMNKINEYSKFRRSLLAKNKVKLVKINSIINGQSKNRKHRKQNLTPRANLKASDLTKETLPIETIEVKDEDDYGSDLLVTKKVVILDDTNKEIEIKRTNVRKRGRPGRKIRSKKKIMIKPCFVQLDRDKQVEKAYVKYCKDMNLNVKTTEVPLTTKKKVSRKQPKLNIKWNRNTMKPSVINQVIADQAKWFENINMILMSRVIETEKKLKDEINSLKSMLILTEQAIGKMKSLDMYCTEFSRNNMIYVVKANKPIANDLLRDEDFISAVELGYIKLVESNLFCKFVKAGMNFTDGESHRAEHNYCYLKT